MQLILRLKTSLLTNTSINATQITIEYNIIDCVNIKLVKKLSKVEQLLKNLKNLKSFKKVTKALSLKKYLSK